ncbi:MAG TPA: hypothetical protein VMD97_01995 [Candidatus Aquilonibacter sp.]|nr:hypothetical protein [Candidatus Aquilonibacter sp.]
MVTKFSRQEIADVCRKLGGTVGPLPSHIEGWQLLWAITGNESSFGADCTPRHEPAYDVGGEYSRDPSQAHLLALYGPAAACSYGPMQVMLVNAPPCTTPESFDDLETAMRAGIYALNRMLQRFQPQSVAQVGFCWNGGHIANLNPEVQAYGLRLTKKYLSTAMPPATQAEVA